MHYLFIYDYSYKLKRFKTSNKTKDNNLIVITKVLVL